MLMSADAIAAIFAAICLHYFRLLTHMRPRPPAADADDPDAMPAAPLRQAITPYAACFRRHLSPFTGLSPRHGDGASRHRMP